MLQLVFFLKNFSHLTNQDDDPYLTLLCGDKPALKCAIKILPTVEPLTLGRIDPCFYVVYTEL